MSGGDQPQRRVVGPGGVSYYQPANQEVTGQQAQATQRQAMDRGTGGFASTPAQQAAATMPAMDYELQNALTELVQRAITGGFSAPQALVHGPVPGAAPQGPTQSPSIQAPQPPTAMDTQAQDPNEGMSLAPTRDAPQVTVGGYQRPTDRDPMANPADAPAVMVHQEPPPWTHQGTGVEELPVVQGPIDTPPVMVHRETPPWTHQGTGVEELPEDKKKKKLPKGEELLELVRDLTEIFEAVKAQRATSRVTPR